MFPSRQQWARWTPLQKWALIGQISVLLTLLATVIFSFLAWREARTAQEFTKAAQEQERAFFIAQNPPSLELTAGRMFESAAGPILFLYIKNVGDSAAISPCTEIKRLNFEPYAEIPLTTNCNPRDSYVGYMLRKGEGVTYHIPQEGYLRYHPQTIEVARPDEPQTSSKPCKGSKYESWLVGLRFEDVAGQKYRVVRQVHLCSR